jgi:hypothetical protein
MKPSGIFFIIFFLVCLFTTILFFFLFRRKDEPLPIPRSILPTGLPGMSKKPATLNLPGMSPSPVKKPLPETKVKSKQPTSLIDPPPLPLIVKVLPPGPALRKKMME